MTVTPDLLPWVVIAGALGAVGRHVVIRSVAAVGERNRHPDSIGGLPTIPIGTMVVNLSGSLVAGVLLGFALEEGRTSLILVLTIGLLGAFTTFSSWMTEVVGLWEEGRRGLAVTHLIVSLVAGVGSAALGLGIWRIL